MERNIIHDSAALTRPSMAATQADLLIATDLRDTLAAHADECVGMAANMIGKNKAIIVVQMGPLAVIMFNPKLTKQQYPYRTQEGCLSLVGERPTTRYQKITVNFQDSHFKSQQQSFTGFIAQIIQHEIDHCTGILI